MEWCHVHGNNDFVVPTGRDVLEVIPPSTEHWFQWGERGFENDGLPGKYSGSFEEENLANFDSDTRVPPMKESNVPRFHPGEGSSSSSPCEDEMLLDCIVRTSDDLFNDLPEFEIQNGMQNMDDIFLDPFPVQDLMHWENPYESIHISDSTHPPLNWRISVLEDSDILMNNFSRREDAISEELNFGDPCTVDSSPIAESFITTVLDEPVCMKATVLQELENVLLKLNRETRICIRDALYRLAKSSKEQHNLSLYQNGNFMDRPSYSEVYCGTSRQEPLKRLEQKTNVIDRAIAALMFDRPDYRLPEFSSFIKNKEAAVAFGS